MRQKEEKRALPLLIQKQVQKHDHGKRVMSQDRMDNGSKNEHNTYGETRRNR